MKYPEQLKDIRWKALRNKILKRDGYQCQYCENRNIINESNKGEIIEITQLQTLQYILNQSDQRFHPLYTVKFRDDSGNEFTEEIKSHFEYKNETFGSFKNKPLYYKNVGELTIGGKILSITCIKNFNEENSWFYVDRLDAHHIEYLGGRLAWEYPEKMLKTLCSKCHKLEHQIAQD